MVIARWMAEQCPVPGRQVADWFRVDW